MFTVLKQCRCSLRGFQKNVMPWNPSKKVPWIQRRLPNGQQNGKLMHYLWWTRLVLKHWLLELWLTLISLGFIYFYIQICRSVDKMCANIYSIRRTVIYFRESEIGVLDYWSEQMCIKTQRFSLLSPAAARISCYDVRPFSKSNPVILVIQYKALSFQDRKMYSLLSTCLNCFRMYSCIQQ